MPVIDPKLDLSFSRQVSAPKALIWRAWTEPELLKQWFCPLPWKTTECEMDLQLGGAFKTVMRSPEGQSLANEGCFLDVQKERRLVWTNALKSGFRPLKTAEGQVHQPGFLFTATVELFEHEGKTTYQASVQHADEASCQQHQAMGFEKGWGVALDQMLAMIARGI